jgi:hypothetical protein
MQITVVRQLKNGVEKLRTKTDRARIVQVEPNLVPLLRVRIPVIAITRFGAWRSLVSPHGDHLFRRIAIGVKRRLFGVRIEGLSAHRDRSEATSPSSF